MLEGQMLRRSIISIAGGVTLGVALPVLGQTPSTGRPRRVGFLGYTSQPGTMFAIYPLAAGLAKKGWIEGNNLSIERLSAEGKPERLAGLADDLVRKGVDVIVTMGDLAAVASARATQTIPIVFVNANYPLDLGLIDSFPRPGRNLTGMAYWSDYEISFKRFQLLRELAPKAVRLSALFASEVLETVTGARIDYVGRSEAVAKSLGFELKLHPILKVEDLEVALREVVTERAQALTAGGTVVWQARKLVADFALNNRLPSAFPYFEPVEAGGLLSYSPMYSEIGKLWTQCIDYVDRILRGARPVDLPVGRPDRYELVINRRTAKALGLTIPQSLLVSADRIIE